MEAINAITQQQINDLAAEGGISAADMKSMALGVAAEIESMRCADYFIANPDMRVELCVIGLEEHAKKFERFASAYRSYPYFRNFVRLGLFDELTKAAQPN